jgi:hypothetical protein
VTPDELLDAYLAGRRSTLWGRAFDIHSMEGRAAAKAWLTQVFVDLHLIRSNNGGAE